MRMSRQEEGDATMHLGPESASVEVLTYREGVLAAVGHDLKLRAERVDIDVDPEKGSVRARVDPRSLHVVAAMKEGREAPGALSARDVTDIERAMQKDVLESDRYPDIQFESLAAGPDTLRGRLTLHGQTREVSAPLRTEDGVRQADFTLDQREFGIRPYRAMLGSLKVRPAVQVRVRLSLPTTGPATDKG